MPVGGRNRYITPAVLGVPNSAEREVKSVVPHWWADWLHNPCRLVGPHLFRARRTMCGGPRVGGVAA